MNQTTLSPARALLLLAFALNKGLQTRTTVIPAWAEAFSGVFFQNNYAKFRTPTRL